MYSSRNDPTWRYPREQAHLPAEQSPPCQDARFPVADAHPRGPGHSGRQTAQGPHRTVGLSRRVGTLVPVLPAGSKLRRSRDFAAVVRYGHRAGTRHLVLHLLLPEQAGSSAADRSSSAPARAGFVVSSKVGNSVVRHRLTRRLRPLILARLAGLPAGTDLVIRALPAAASARSASLASDLDSGLRAACRKAGHPAAGTWSAAR